MARFSTSLSILRLVGAAGALGCAFTATAALANDVLPVAVAAAPIATHCDSLSGLALTAPSAGVPVSKSAAILGGAQSALEAIRTQQASLDEFGPLIPAVGKLEPAADIAPSPVAASCPISAAPVPQLVASRTDLTAGTRKMGADDFLGTRRIAISKTFFDKQWHRVSREAAPSARRLHGLPQLSGDRLSKLSDVNRWVNRAITYTEDRDLFGKADHWAGPRKTLALGKGDCEDYALLKMQLLAAAGVPREDMFLTVARDLVRRADHAVLIVRTDDGFRMLDNATDTVLDAGAAYDYRPVLSFSGSNAWVHGYLR